MLRTMTPRPTWMEKITNLVPPILKIARSAAAEPRRLCCNHGLDYLSLHMSSYTSRICFYNGLGLGGECDL